MWRCGGEGEGEGEGEGGWCGLGWVLRDDGPGVGGWMER